MRLVSCVLAVCLVPAVATAADTVTTPAPGIKRIHRTTTSQNINVLVVDLCKPGVSVRATKSTEKQRTVSSFAGLVTGAKAAINGDFFSYDTYSTTGPAMGEGGAWGGVDSVGIAPVQFGDHRIALPGAASTAGIQAWARQAVSGHPSLIVNGTKKTFTNDLCTARHPRTALGISKDHKALVIAVIDGRATGRLGMTCAEEATLLAEFGAHDGVNLDGGGSSTMWLAGPGVVNYPSDGAQRVVANHLAIRATGAGDAAHCPLASPDATFLAADARVELTSGEEAVVWMELANTGDIAWTPEGTRVGTQDPEDRDSAFFKAENWIAANRPTGADGSYASGATGRFTWAMVAPEVTESTTFDETFQLVQEGIGYFGPTHTMSIVVHPSTGPTDPTDPHEAHSTGCSTGGGGVTLALLALRLRRRRCASPRSNGSLRE